MTNYAVLDGNSIVTNIIVANSLNIAEQITFSTCALIPSGTVVDIGYSYSGGAFVAPTEETPAEDTPSEETPA